MAFLGTITLGNLAVALAASWGAHRLLRLVRLRPGPSRGRMMTLSAPATGGADR